MHKPTLFLMLGFPGAGKTTAAKIIHDLTGATHIWEDKVRLEKFPHLAIVANGDSSFPKEQNDELHSYLNTMTSTLLAQGNSVIYDTSFNRREDRERMYRIAAANRAEVKLIWVKTDKAIARQRATQDAAKQETRVLATALGDMDEATFERLSNKLEPPQADEYPIKIDGMHITPTVIMDTLNLPDRSH